MYLLNRVHDKNYLSVFFKNRKISPALLNLHSAFIYIQTLKCIVNQNGWVTLYTLLRKYDKSIPFFPKKLPFLNKPNSKQVLVPQKKKAPIFLDLELTFAQKNFFA